MVGPAAMSCQEGFYFWFLVVHVLGAHCLGLAWAVAEEAGRRTFFLSPSALSCCFPPDRWLAVPFVLQLCWECQSSCTITKPSLRFGPVDKSLCLIKILVPLTSFPEVYVSVSFVPKTTRFGGTVDGNYCLELLQH